MKGIIAVINDADHRLFLTGKRPARAQRTGLSEFCFIGHRPLDQKISEFLADHPAVGIDGLQELNTIGSDGVTNMHDVILFQIIHVDPVGI